MRPNRPTVPNELGSPHPSGRLLINQRAIEVERNHFHAHSLPARMTRTGTVS
jgi:hypothetical protein